MRPSIGGSGYFGQGYRWEQVLHYKYWIYVAIKAIMDEVDEKYIRRVQESK